MRALAIIVLFLAISAQVRFYSIRPRQVALPALLIPIRPFLRRGEPRQDLPCSVISIKPVLGFDLRFHSGYEVSVPLKELAGSENMLTILFRVSTIDADHGSPFISFTGSKFQPSKKKPKGMRTSRAGSTSAKGDTRSSG